MTEHVHTWKRHEPYCEDCGSHSGFICTDDDCCEIVDHVWQADQYDQIDATYIDEDDR